MSQDKTPDNTGCDVCGKMELLLFNCNYCGGSYCSEHRLPENHACTGKYREKGNWFRTSKADVQTAHTRKIEHISYTREKGYDSRRRINRLKIIISYILTGCYVLFFSLPVGVAIMVSSANLDPLTRLLLHNVINQINLSALGFVICSCYLFYQKFTIRDTVKAYLIVAVLSVASTWILLDKAAILFALNYMLGGQPQTVPNILDLYMLWVYILLDTSLSLINSLFQNYIPGKLFINNLRKWVAEQAKKVLK